MSNLQKNDQNVTRSSRPGDDSLSSRIRQAVWGQSHQNAGTVPPTSALLLDISGSMGEHAGANVRKIDRLRQLADEFIDCRRFQFETFCEELAATDGVSEPRGGTALHSAFQHVKAKGVKHVVLITDGIPDNEQYAMRDAANLKVDVFYVGPDPAPRFLRELAGHTGGQYGAASLDALKALTVAVRGLLPAGSGGVIAL